MSWLERRNGCFIASHHPLRETLIRRLGPDAKQRHEAMAQRYLEATQLIPYLWRPGVRPEQ
jgi:hypothetical protein